MNSSFVEFSLVALVALEAVMFGAFGVLYSVYNMYMLDVTPDHPYPASISRVLRNLCLFLNAMMWGAVILSLLCLYKIEKNGFIENTIMFGLAALLLALVVTSQIISSKMKVPKQDKVEVRKS